MPLRGPLGSRKLPAATVTLDDGAQVAVQALPAKVFEGLLAKHPGDEQGNYKADASLWPVLLAACVEGDNTEVDWAEPDTLSSGELDELRGACWEVNRRRPSTSVGKGSA